MWSAAGLAGEPQWTEAMHCAPQHSTTRERDSGAQRDLLAIPALFCCCQLLLAQHARSRPHRPHLLPKRRALRCVLHADLFVSGHTESRQLGSFFVDSLDHSLLTPLTPRTEPGDRPRVGGNGPTGTNDRPTPSETVACFVLVTRDETAFRHRPTPSNCLLHFRNSRI